MIVIDPRQKIALSGVIASLFFSFSYILIATLYFPFRMPEIQGALDKLVFAWQCMLFAALPLSGGLIAMMVRKLLRPTTLDGEPVLDGSRLDIHIRFVRDTAYQLLLFGIVLFNLALFLDGGPLRLLPVLTSWFILARIFYWGAYLINPPHRIFGASATLGPTVFFMLLCLLHILGVL